MAALLGGLFGACGGGAEEPPLSGGTAAAPGLSLDSQVTVTEAEVTVRYTIANQGDTAVFLADGVPRAAGAGVRFDPATAYVVGDPERDDGVLVTQRVFPWPGDFEAVTPPTVGITEVAPGETVERTLVVPRPFVRLHPFGDDVGDGPIALPADPATVAFCLGVLPSPLPPQAGAERREGVSVVAHGNALDEAQSVLCGEPVDLR